MNKLISELQRLYFLPEQQWLRPDDEAATPTRLPTADIAPALAGEGLLSLILADGAGLARVMVVEFKRAADWEQAGLLHQAVQEDLELPAPAISVSAQAGFCLWFSLAEALPVAQIADFLAALRQRYLADLPDARLALLPGATQPSAAPPLVPAFDVASDKWSAFIDPTMGSMFVAEPGLDMAPNLDRQADMLAGCKSIKTADFLRALATLQSEAAANIEAAAAVISKAESRLALGSDYRDPKSFLLAVMNDPTARARDRIRAAKALLPYFAGATEIPDTAPPPRLPPRPQD